MHLSFFYSAEDNEPLVQALLELADVVGFFKMQGESLVVTVVPVGVVFSAGVAVLVVLLHVLHEGSHVEEEHLAELTPWVEEDYFPVLIDLSFVKVAL